MELSLYQSRGDQEKGFLLYQDLIWKWGFSTKLTARFALFDVSDYEARLYAYENDVLGFFSIPPYSGTGTRSYLILQFRALSFLDGWLRLAQTRMYPEKRRLREIKVQVRLRF